jgi:DNA-binding NarL/FixJ family response regulator
MSDRRILMVDDDPLVVRALTHVIRQAQREPVVVGTAREARALLSNGESNWAGIIIDIGLPDGSGLDLLARVRATHPSIPAMVLTGSVDAKAANAAYDLRAQYVIKPVARDRIRRFLCEAAAHEAGADLSVHIERSVDASARASGLSEAEHDILRRSALGQDRETIARERSASRLTVDKQVTNLLRLTGDASLHAAVERILRVVAGELLVNTRN